MSFGQLATEEMGATTLRLLTSLFAEYPNLVGCVMEDYRVYGWRAKQHSFSELHTSQLIGMIQTVALSNGVEYHKQPASVAKGFVKDDQLKEWGFWDKTAGLKHARDAIRHACYFITFGSRDKWSARKGRSRGKTVG
jgi:hypothetical protein